MLRWAALVLDAARFVVPSDVPFPCGWKENSIHNDPVQTAPGTAPTAELEWTFKNKILVWA
mgnify:CR=1 FL=1